MGPNVSDFSVVSVAPADEDRRQFENLDESVQAEFETYLEERGVNSSLALFIPDLAEHKEQKCVLHSASEVLV